MYTMKWERRKNNLTVEALRAQIFAEEFNEFLLCVPAASSAPLR